MQATQAGNGAIFNLIREIPQSAFRGTFQEVFDTSISPETEAVKTKMRRGPKIGECFEIVFGLKTGDDSRFIHHNRGLHREDKPLLRGSDVKRYEFHYKGEYVWYVPDKMRSLHSTARPGEPSRFEQAKVLVKDTSKDFACTYEPGKHYVKDVLIVIPKQGKPSSYDLRFIAGVINSRALYFYYRTTFKTIHVQTEELADIPLPILDLATAKDRSKHDRLVRLVTGMLTAKTQHTAAKSEATRGVTQRQIEAIDSEINDMVYSLYGLTTEEISIVERND
jgi:hypothetical protein